MSERAGKLVLATLGLIAALAVAVGSSVFAYGWFFIGTCNSIDDTGGRYPTSDSPQGRVCGQYPTSWLEWLPVLIPVAGLVAFTLVVVAWRRGGARARAWSVAGLVVLPLMTTVLLSLPPNA